MKKSFISENHSFVLVDSDVRTKTMKKLTNEADKKESTMAISKFKPFQIKEYLHHGFSRHYVN